MNIVKFDCLDSSNNRICQSQVAAAAGGMLKMDPSSQNVFMSPLPCTAPDTDDEMRCVFVMYSCIECFKFNVVNTK